jgi:hypothetical protein
LGHNKGRADLRAAFVQRDPQVQATKDRLDEISYVLEVLRGKMQAFFNAYNSVKKLVSERGLPGQQYGDANRPAPYAPPKTIASQPKASEDDLPPGFRAK